MINVNYSNNKKTGEFLSKPLWRKLYKSKIQEFETASWRVRIQNDNDFDRFKFLHLNIENAIIWECSTDYQSLASANIVSRLWSQKPTLSNYSYLCHICGTFFTDINLHMIFECKLSEQIRLKFVFKTDMLFGRDLVNEVFQSAFEEGLQILIGRRTFSIQDKKIHKHFLRIAINFVSKCLKMAENFL